MKHACSRVVWTIGLISVGAAAVAAEPKKPPSQEPAGFISGAVIGAFAGGPIGAVVGAGLGTWLGNRVHRAAEAGQANAKLAMLETDNAQLRAQLTTLATEKSVLAQSNSALTARLSEVSLTVEGAERVAAGKAAIEILDGLQSDVLFRTGSAKITPDMARAISVLADTVARSPALNVRIDGYADPRGSDKANMKLSQKRADAVRALFVAAGVDEDALEVNAYGKSSSIAADLDGYALERRVRLTLKLPDETAVARSSVVQPPIDGALLPFGDER